LKKKVNAHGREKTLKFGAVEINFKWRTNIWSKATCLPQLGYSGKRRVSTRFFFHYRKLFYYFLYFGLYLSMR
jgi:hypothetical protein